MRVAAVGSRECGEYGVQHIWQHIFIYRNASLLVFVSSQVFGVFFFLFFVEPWLRFGTPFLLSVCTDNRSLFVASFFSMVRLFFFFFKCIFCIMPWLAGRGGGGSDEHPTMLNYSGV